MTRTVFSRRLVGCVLFLFCGVCGLVAQEAPSAEGRAPEKQHVQIGVLIQESMGACLEAWSPMAEYLSAELPAYHFTIVPLASRDDVFQTIDEEAAPFLILDPVVYVEAEQRYQLACLATRFSRQADAIVVEHGGALLRRSDDRSIRTIHDLSGKVLAVPRGVAFSSWGMQRLTLLELGFDTDRDLKKVVFAGSQREVVDAVLGGIADAGAVDADWLAVAMRSGDIPSKQLFAFDREGTATPLSDPPPHFTQTFPDWPLAAMASTDQRLAEQVTKALFEYQPEAVHAETGQFAGWTVPRSYQPVRREIELLQNRQREAGASKNLLVRSLRGEAAARKIVALSMLLFATLAVCLIGFRHMRRQMRAVTETLDATSGELAEVRADKHHVETILAATKIGIDVCDIDGNLEYVDSGLERIHGTQWHGKNCYTFFRETQSPDVDRLRLAACEGREPVILPIHAEGNTTHAIGVPFTDEAGVRLLARLRVSPALLEMLAQVPESQAVDA